MFSGLMNLGKRLTPRAVKRVFRRARLAAGDLRLLEQLDWIQQGYLRQSGWSAPSFTGRPVASANPLEAFFRSRREGRGIWKWDHYFDIYHRHLSKFRGREVSVVEIGIYSGGSLEMWKDYFGPKCRIYGVDIQDSCKQYEDEQVTVYVGDQADRNFWTRFKAEVPPIDIVLDDGGHEPDQQSVTLEELLPHLRPGGVFLCEDIHGSFNEFASYVQGMIHALNDVDRMEGNPELLDRRLVSKASDFQSVVHSIHAYPFVTVIEKRESPLAEFVAPKRGTQWAPFIA